MKILDFLKPAAVTANLESTNKKDAIEELVDLLVKSDDIKSAKKKDVVRSVLEREGLGSTGIGQGVAIPHSKSPLIKDLVGAFAISKKGINFESLDGKPAHIFFLLLASSDTTGPHLKALARISRLLKDKYFRDALIQAKTDKEVYEIIAREDKTRD